MNDQGQGHVVDEAGYEGGLCKGRPAVQAGEKELVRPVACAQGQEPRKGHQGHVTHKHHGHVKHDKDLAGAGGKVHGWALE